MKTPALFLLALLCASPAAADVNEAAAAAAALVAEKPAGAEQLFDKTFFRHISLEKLNSLFSGLYRDHGPVSATLLVSSKTSSGHFLLDTARGWRIPAALSVDQDSGKINGLYFSPPYRKDETLAGVKERLAALPGRKGLLVRRLGARPETLEALAEDEYFAVGSLFKLYVLGTMLKEKTAWDKVHRLREEDRSLPSGRLQDWPAGSPLTVHTLAALMVSESDNTASDALIGAVGRRRIEGALAGLGHSDPARLRPFLKTSEVFRLKSATAASLKYLNLPTGEKYGFLDTLAREPLDLDRLPRSPFGIDKIEWPASPADLCRLMDFFAASGNTRALELLALNPGLKEARENFAYAGYKGGSEPGVLAMAWLLKNKEGAWYCLAASWNDEKKDVEQKEFLALMQSALNALAAAGQGQ